MAVIPKFLVPPAQRHGRAFYWLLMAVAGALVIYLWNAQPPWDAKLRRGIESREAAGRPWKVEQYVLVYEWVAAVVNVLLAVGLFATLRFWSRPLGDTEKGLTAEGAMSPSQNNKWLFVGLGMALLLGASFRVQMLDHSLWADEEYTVRTHIWGQMVEQEDGRLERQPVSWRDTFFRNKGNNHLGYTIPTRVLHDAWANIRTSDDRPFSEAAVRILPLLASLASIVLIGLLVARNSGPIAGLGAAFLLAISPWHIRYSVEARGYSQMIFFLLLAFIFMIRALRSGRWRDWLWMAAAQLGAMLCVPVAVDVLIIADATVIFMTAKRSRRDRVTIASRMVVANVLAAMIYLQLIAPSIQQILTYLKTGSLVGHMSPDWWREVWINLTSGLSSSDPNPGVHIGSSFAEEAAAHSEMRALFLVGLPGFMLLGITGAILRRSWLLLPCLATIAGAVLAFTRNQLAGDVMHPWYVIYVLIGFVVFVALGIEFAVVAIGSALAGKQGRSAGGDVKLALASAVAMLALISVYGIETAHARQIECQHSRQPIREVVATVRGANAYSPDDDNLITASFGTCKGMLVSYDPRNHVLKKPAELRALVGAAEAGGKRLVVYVCNLEHARHFDTDMLGIVEDPELFRERQDLVPGLGEIFTYHVYEFRGTTGEHSSRPAESRRGF